MGESMRSKAVLDVSRLPHRLPVGTRYVIEGQDGRIRLRYLEFPDGRQIHLPSDLAARTNARARLTLGRQARQKTAARKF